MRSAAFILLACLLFVHVKGMTISKGRCLCMDPGVNFIRPKLIEKIEVVYPTSSCPHLEIIATLKESGQMKCLNPDSRFAKNFIKDEQNKKRNLE